MMRRGLSIFVALAVCAGTVNADRIGINFVGGTSDGIGDNSLDGGIVTRTAGVVPQPAWNNLEGATGTSAALLEALPDDSNATTTATVEWTSPNVWNNAGINPDGGNGGLIRGYLDNVHNGGSISVNDIPYDLYDVYVYGDSDRAIGVIDGYLVNGGDQQDRVEDDLVAPVMQEGVDYVRFLDVGGSSFTVTAVQVEGNAAAPVSGLQIVERLVESRLRLTIDRDTGSMTLANNTGGSIDISGYAVTSVDGSLNPDDWISISGNYDASGDGSVDPANNWSVSSATADDLSEAASAGDATLGNQQAIDLGPGWEKYYEDSGDLAFEYMLGDGSQVTGILTFTGNDGNAFAYGDLNFDGMIDIADFEDTLRPGYGSDTTGLSIAEAYRLGDLDANMVIDETDALMLKNLIVDASGAVAGLAIANVPEPSSLILLGLGGLLLVTRLRKPVQARLSLSCFLLAVAIGAIFFAPGVTHADMIPGAIAGVTGTAFQQGDNADPGDGSLSRIFDGAGLTVGDAASSDTWTHNAAWPDNWQGNGSFTNGETPGAWLIADLGSVYDDLDDLFIWNVREVLDRGTKDFDLYYAVDPTVAPETGSPYDFSSGGWTSLGSHTINQATAADTPPDMILDLDDVPSARYFGFDIESNYGSTFRVGFAELQFAGDPSRLTLEVNTSTGATTILNEGESPIDLDLYRITSDSGSLDPTGWTSLEEQGINDDGVPNNGIGWETLGTTAQTLSEIILMGNDGSDFSTLGPGGTISLGNAFSRGDQDLVFEHHVPGTGATLFVEGTIEYVDTGVLLGDVNLDTVVNGLDVDPFVDVLLNGPYQAEADMNEDTVVNGLDVDPFVAAVVGGGLQAVPEPSTLALLGLALVGLLTRGRFGRWRV